MIRWDRFIEITKGLDWEDIKTLERMAIEGDCVTEEFKREGWKLALRQLIRQEMNRRRGPNGERVFHSVVVVDGDRKRRVYKQEALFDINDYRQAIDYHAKMSKAHRAEAEGLVRRCRERYLVQLALPWAVGE